MKRFAALMLVMILLMASLPGSAFAKAKQMNDDVPVWTEAEVRQYALDYIEGKSMSRLWGYYDLQIRRYMPMATYEALLIDLEWMTGGFIELGSYRSFEEPEQQLKTHVLHLCMEKQDLDMYFTHKNKEDDWEIMALEFVPAEKEALSNGGDMLVDGSRSDLVKTDYTETDVTVGSAPYELHGVLTMPNEASADTPVPACVFVHDFDGLDCDSTLGKTTFFKDLAQALAAMGIASVRYDKRTYTYNTQTFETVEEEVCEDAVSAAQLLKQDARVDSQRIVVIGHGLGALLAPRIASEADGVFTGMILIGGTPKSLLEVYLQGNEAAALSDEERATLEGAVRKPAGFKESKAREMTVFGRNGYYFWEDLQYDAVELIKKLKLPTYVAQGKQDPIVDEDNGRRLYAEKIGDNMNFMTFKAFRGLNHMLMNDLTVNSQGGPEYSVETHLDTQAGRNLSQWILGLYMTQEE